ncbi:sensor domain-containing diguanylate cyclase [Sulfuricurvum sp.]|uniref:sensor domain-containing diguanylate cyclase n=1 Tax=Sulfuricurvum sp. TaxID=2025608 RepID=UPI002D6A8AC7|nr:diguanylate cyclase [Sulfuricurvum sp.]HZF70678.1 diguanylate cyclase [Sulfuricurvum sp.]
MKKTTLLQRTVVWLIAIAMFFFLLLLSIIWELKQSVLQGYDPSLTLIVMYFIGVSIVIGLIIKVFRSFSKPITELTENALKIADGDYNVHFNIENYDVEWQFLMSIFNQMSVETQRKIEQLNNQNEILFTYKEQIEELNQRLAKKIKIKSKQLQGYLDIIDNYVITSQTDIYGTITYASEAFCQISGYTKEELIGENHRIIRHPDMPSELFRELWATISSGKIWHGEIKNRKSDGGDYWVDTTITPNIEEGEITGYTAVRHDITDQKLIEEMAITDSMTGLYNRRFYAKIIDDELDRVKRHHSSLALMMLDVDNFKLYNDSYGHHAGDTVLSKIANVLKFYTSRCGEFAFRLGGEEFGVIVSDMNEEKYRALAEHIRTSVEKLAIVHEKNDAAPYVSVSIGIALYYPDSLMTSDELYKEADTQLYRAKENGRNQVVIGNEF